VLAKNAIRLIPGIRFEGSVVASLTRGSDGKIDMEGRPASGSGLQPGTSTQVLLR
jgi:hypothetical protein